MTMMSFSGRAPDNQLVVRYLVGGVSEEEAERLDELSIVDDAFAQRLREAENDLVDAYVNGELSGETLALFETRYLALPDRREKVQFAETLHAYRRRQDARVDPRAIPQKRSWSRLAPQWGLAAAVVLLAAGTMYLFDANRRLHHQVASLSAERGTMRAREGDLQKRLAEQQFAAARATNDLARLQESLGQRQVPPSFVLPPVTRGAGELTTLAIPSAASEVRLELQLELDEFPGYRAALKVPSSDRTLWRSGALKSAGGAGSKSVAITLPATLLKPRTYSVDLTGIPSSGEEEVIGSYTFRVAAK
jgi:hypothetical protein